MYKSSSVSPHLHCTSLLPGAGFEISFSWWYWLTPEFLRLTCNAVGGFFALWLVDLWLMIHWPKEYFTRSGIFRTQNMTSYWELNSTAGNSCDFLHTWHEVALEHIYYNMGFAHGWENCWVIQQAWSGGQESLETQVFTSQVLPLASGSCWPHP